MDLEVLPEPEPDELEAIRAALVDDVAAEADTGAWWRAGLPAGDELGAVDY